VALATHIEEEMWLEDTGYAWPDDQVFFYKAFLNGAKTVIAQASYKHLDAKSGNHKEDKMYKDFYTHQRNISIFWYKFLFKREQSQIRKIALCAAIVYRHLAQTTFFIAKCILRRKFCFITQIAKPYGDVYKYIINDKQR